MRTKLTITLDESASEIVARCDNASLYFSELLTRNWASWRRALLETQAAGWTNEEISAACRELNGSWLLRGTEFHDRQPALAEIAKRKNATPTASLELLAWEYWHANTELRRLLDAPEPAEKLAAKKKAKAGKAK